MRLNKEIRNLAILLIIEMITVPIILFLVSEWWNMHIKLGQIYFILVGFLVFSAIIGAIIKKISEY